MAGDATRPLSTEEAKARLRSAVENASPAAWVKRHPLRALSLAIACGVIAAQFRRPVAGNLLMAQRLLLPLLLGATKRK